MQTAPHGADATVIGTVAEAPAGKVYVRTAFGATRIMDMLVGEQLPRIC
jgi:hydrogenase expression/formation protein HypE